MTSKLNGTLSSQLYPNHLHQPQGVARRRQPRLQRVVEAHRAVRVERLGEVHELRGALQRLLFREARDRASSSRRWRRRRAGGARRRERRCCARRCWCPGGSRRAGRPARALRARARAASTTPLRRASAAMKYDRPSSSESCTRMLVCRSHARQRHAAARRRTPPACASTTLRPIERSSVLLPDMFEPVIEQERARRADRDVVGDAAIVGQAADGRCASAVASPASSVISGTAQSGLSRRALASSASASSSPSASSQPRTRGPVARRQRSSANSTWKSHSVSAWIGKVQDRRAVPQLAEAEDAVQPAHAAGAGSALADSRSCSAASRGALTARVRRARRARRSGQRILPAAGPVEGHGLHALASRKRQDDAGQQRNRPERHVRHAGRVSAIEDPHRSR